MVSTLSMLATMAVLEKVDSAWARVMALALVGAAAAAGRELLHQGSWQARVAGREGRNAPVRHGR